MPSIKPPDQTIETQNPSTKNCTILITKSTSGPLKASPTTTQPLETQLNNIEEGIRLTAAAAVASDTATFASSEPHREVEL